ncbi:PIN domain-containing protein [Erwinia mallotivora]|uniref:Toxin-antitoxin system, toxin component, PIN family n=1 Tax=Erwinia mallotivora TaxID=69222 RepID=A0A014PSF5_9GAMM|nr:PIN domain-containing protein [Erwinia mallotivora]EXU73787.1 toxin-antitoxin system, toxin component, PIN family [Erwinia mallotivora]
MIHSPYPVVLDACVIYPSLLRDVLIYSGLKGLYQPKWTAIIQDEWQRNLKPGVSVEEYLEALKKQGLNLTVKELKMYHSII